MGSMLYWQGDLEWRDGALRPASASLYARPSAQRSTISVANDGTVTRSGTDEDDAKAQQIEEALQKKPYDPGNRDRRIASCERFDGPLECSRGKIFWRTTGSFAGAWRYGGTRYKASSPGEPPRYVAEGTQDILPQGWGTRTYADGQWVEAHFDEDGDLDDVGKCDDPGSSANFRCSLEGDTVMFTADQGSQGRGSQSRPRREAATPAYTAPSYNSGGGRFVPQVVPQRPVYVLPGMR